MKALTYVLFYGWVGALVLLGGAGIVTGRWELEHIFGLPLDAMPREGRDTFLNQYRFLKAIEFGFGLFCVVYRQEIFSVRVLNRLFLAVALLGAVARAVSMGLDGWPHPAMAAVTAIEFATVIAVYLYTRPRLAP